MAQKPLPTMVQNLVNYFRRNKGSASLETFRQKSNYGNQIAAHIAFVKNILVLLASLIFHEFQYVRW